jgi:hypothetical protein
MSQELCDVFEDKLFPPAAGAIPVGDRGQGLGRAAALFEAAAMRLSAPDAVSRVDLSGEGRLFSPPIHHGFPKMYVVCMWIRLDAQQDSESISLFKVRASNQCTTDCLLTLGDTHSDTHSRLTLRAKLNHRDMQTASGRVNLEADMTWRLVTVMHRYRSFPFSGTATCLIDGDIALEQDLDYPFKPLSALPSSAANIVFEFGEGLKGSLGAVSVFAAELSVQAVRSMHDAGPGFVSWAGTAPCPQHSAETGHTHLSLNFDKLVFSGEMKPPVFYLTARHFDPAEGLSCLVPSGRAAAGDQLELEPPPRGFADSLAPPRLVGACSPCLATQQRLWEDVGGPSIVLFMLHQCIKDSTEHSSNISLLERVVLSAVRLVTALVQESMLMREVFLQEHGFHVLALCLRALPRAVSSGLLGRALVDACIQLARGLKTDLAEGGDAAAAALQGVLFDFGIWKHASLANRIHLLDSVAQLAPSIGSSLKQFIGLRRVLDLAREHMLGKSPAPAPAAGAGAVAGAGAGHGPTLSDAEQERAEEAVIRLVTLILKAAQEEYDSSALMGASHNHKIVPQSEQPFAEIDMIFSCLEETTNTRFAERLILHAIELLYECPRAFTRALASTRFYDVTAVKLLASPRYSPEMRRATLHLFLWGLIQAHPDLARDLLYWLKKFSRGAEGEEVWYQHDAHNLPTQPSEPERRKVRRPSKYTILAY